jgi:hypothetical protein
VQKLVNETVKEEGCIEYGLYQELSNSDVLTFLEEWRDENSLDEHMEPIILEKSSHCFQNALYRKLRLVYTKKALTCHLRFFKHMLFRLWA